VDQDISKRGLLLVENIPRCIAGPSHTTNQADGSLVANSITQRLPFSGLDNVHPRNPTTCRSTNLNITEMSSSDPDAPNEVPPVIALIPPTPRGAVGSLAPPDLLITFQKFLAARSNILLKHRSSFTYSAPPLRVAPCLVCSRPVLSEVSQAMVSLLAVASSVRWGTDGET